MESLKVLITVKTYPIPSAKYDELVCTAGVTEAGDFVRLYPINFRDLPFTQQYEKYQWIRIRASKHTGRDARKESYRPDCDSLEVLGNPIPSNPGNWSERGKYALAKRAASLEELCERQASDRTSLGNLQAKGRPRPRDRPRCRDMESSVPAGVAQARLLETRGVTKEPPRKVPFWFQYRFTCDDRRCKGHQMMIEDWEVGALYWRLVDHGEKPSNAAEKVREKFLTQICSAANDTYFFVGTILAHPKSWVVLGVFYPKKHEPVINKQLDFGLSD